MALTFQLCSKTEVIGGDTYENKKERPMRRQNPRPIPVDKADIRETVDAIVTNVVRECRRNMAAGIEVLPAVIHLVRE